MTLGELELRSRTGASVVSAVRNGAAIHGLGAQFRLQPDDVLLVTGLHSSIEASRALLSGQPFDGDED